MKGGLREVYKDLMSILSNLINPRTGLVVPVARNDFSDWENPPSPPFIAYLENSSNNFGADNQVYFTSTNFAIEVYGEQKEGLLEEALRERLNEHGIYWEYRGDTKIERENLHLSIYTI